MTPKYQDTLNGKTWNIIKNFCISYSISIKDYKNDSSQSEITIKPFFVLKYDIQLKNWNMYCIKEVENTYNKVLRGIQLQKQELLANIPDKPIAPRIILFNKSLTIIDICLYNIHIRCNNNQSAPILISNLVPYHPIFNIQDDCKCISMCSMAILLLI